jgi:hypothetical protein
MTQTFKQTCDKPYLRHDYKLVLSSGKEVIFDSYDLVHATWFQTPKQFLSHVEVLDKIPLDKKKKNGFGYGK